jgi:hypothetical protein
MKGQNLPVFWCLFDPNFLCVKNKNVSTTTVITPRSITRALNSKGFRASFQIGFNELLDLVIVTRQNCFGEETFVI